MDTVVSGKIPIRFLQTSLVSRKNIQSDSKDLFSPSVLPLLYYKDQQYISKTEKEGHHQPLTTNHYDPATRIASKGLYTGLQSLSIVVPAMACTTTYSSKEGRFSMTRFIDVLGMLQIFFLKNHISACSQATEICNSVMEQKFCQISGKLDNGSEIFFL